MTNCYCNICSVPMSKLNPHSGRNFCSKVCEAIDAFSGDSKLLLNHAHKGRSPVALDMNPWPPTRSPLRSYHPSTSLRVRGIRAKRLTTKKVLHAK